MSRMFRTLAFLTASCITLFVFAAGCASTVKSIDDSEELAEQRANTEGTLVFGKFRLVRNGYEASIDDGIFATTAQLNLYDDADRSEITGKIGHDGEFAWLLKPGDYRLTSVGFDNLGKRVETPAKIAFVVTENSRPVYVGTVILQTTFDSGFYGTSGVVDNYSVVDDCATDCAERLDRLGLNADVTVSLLQNEGRLANSGSR